MPSLTSGPRRVLADLTDTSRDRGQTDPTACFSVFLISLSLSPRQPRRLSSRFFCPDRSAACGRCSSTGSGGTAAARHDMEPPRSFGLSKAATGRTGRPELIPDGPVEPMPVPELPVDPVPPVVPEPAPVLPVDPSPEPVPVLLVDPQPEPAPDIEPADEVSIDDPPPMLPKLVDSGCLPRPAPPP